MKYLLIAFLILAFCDSNQRNSVEGMGLELSSYGGGGFRKLEGVRKAPGGRKAWQQRASLSVTQLSDL